VGHKPEGRPGADVPGDEQGRGTRKRSPPLPPAALHPPVDRDHRRDRREHHRRHHHHRDDLLGVDPLQVDRGGGEVGVLELALDDVQRHALAGELERVRVTQLVRREPAPETRPGRDSPGLGASWRQGVRSGVQRTPAANGRAAAAESKILV
jgi:hypothetical protein